MEHKILLFTGIALSFHGLIGGFELLEYFTGWKHINKLSKDQVTFIIGMTWIMIASS